MTVLSNQRRPGRINWRLILPWVVATKFVSAIHVFLTRTLIPRQDMVLFDRGQQRVSHCIDPIIPCPLPQIGMHEGVDMACWYVYYHAPRTFGIMIAN